MRARPGNEDPFIPARWKCKFRATQFISGARELGAPPSSPFNCAEPPVQRYGNCRAPSAPCVRACVRACVPSLLAAGLATMPPLAGTRVFLTFFRFCFTFRGLPRPSPPSGAPLANAKRLSASAIVLSKGPRLGPNHCRSGASLRASRDTPAKSE
jgi:hypothetical protein